MARNIEIKARLVRIESIEAQVAALADVGPIALSQDDSFFQVAQGRLKLRTFADGSAELIAYARSDRRGPKLSDYTLVQIADPAALHAVLVRSCGLRGRVRKQRTLYRIGPTRVHLDRVEGLGDFLELEVVLQDDQPEHDGVAIAHALLARWGIAEDRLIAGAYVDLLGHRE
jgi:predicted adenylyl cyclase CyaB